MDFEEHRDHLRAVAYRMLGSASEADDAVQEAWLRSHDADPDNAQAWLTTVVARVCLNMLRSRRRVELRVPDPVVTAVDGPEEAAVIADSVGLALLVVLEQLTPAERLAFVLHDLFGVPFEEIAPMLDRTPAAARQLASRARRRVRGGAPSSDPDRARQREVVNAFFAAARDGDIEGLVAVLDPEVVLRADGGEGRPQTVVLRGARPVAGQAVLFGKLYPYARPALVNGAAGAVIATDPGRVLSIMGFTVTNGRIAAIDVLSDPDRL